jgi:hypothetical protein
MPTYEEMEEWRKEWKKEREEFEKELEEKRRKRWEEEGIKPFKADPPPKQRCDHPNTMEDSTATVLWIAAMIVSLLFTGGWILCILETIIWWKHITRHNNTKQK